MTDYHSLSTFPVSNYRSSSPAAHHRTSDNFTPRARQETGDIDVIRYTLSLTGLDDYVYKDLGTSNTAPSGIRARLLCHSPGQRRDVKVDVNLLQQNQQLVHAITVIQRRWRLKRRPPRACSLGSSKKEAELAAVKLQKVWRSFKSRKEVLVRLHVENKYLHKQCSESNAALARTTANLEVQKGNVETLSKTVTALRRQLDRKSSVIDSLESEIRSLKKYLAKCGTEEELGRVAWEMYEERGDKERLLSQSINGPSSNSYSSMSSISPPQLSKLDTKSIWDSDDVKGSSDTLFTPTSASGSLEDDATVNVDVSSLGLDMDGEGNVYYLVDRITRTNDQPASLLLQQQLKSPSSPAHLQILFAAIMSQALPLMKNRFGNFLMQRLLETGTQEMKEGVATVMRGRIVELSCDRFGCHVVQKALETLAHPHPLIHELLLSASPRASHKAASLSGGSHNSISNSTLTHRFACHVWQRIFQLRYTPDPIPSIVTYLASELAGNWHKIANDENGSLVVQSIFEGCGGEKKDIVREILGRCGEVARGQWGNWVIQHLLEHGTPSDRQAILSVLASHFYTLSLDQYASKVLEKALKYCTKRDLFSVMELLLSPQQTGAQGQKCLILNMMGHQYANYVVQHLIMAGDQMQREMIVRVLLPHVGGLRNSKFGQRVAGLVEKIARGRGLVGAATNISTLGMNVNVGSLSNGNANLTSVNINALSIPTIPGLENYDYPPINVGLRC